MFGLIFTLIARILSIFFQITHNFGLSIIGLTLIVRLVVFPLTAKQVRSMQAMARLQPEVKKLQAQYKGDRQKLNEEMMKFYQANKVNPASGCLPLLIQAPIFLVLFRVLRGLTASKSFDWLLIRVGRPHYLTTSSELYRALVKSGGQMKSFGIDLAQSASSQHGVSKALPYYLLVAAVGVSGYLQQHQTSKRQPASDNPQAQQMQTIMKFMPIFFTLITFGMQAGIVVYWLTSNIFAIGQQAVLLRMHPPTPAAEILETTTVDSDSKAPVTAKAVKSGGGPVPAPAPAKPQTLQQKAAEAARARAAKGRGGTGATAAPPKPWVKAAPRQSTGSNQKKKRK